MNRISALLLQKCLPSDRAVSAAAGGSLNNDRRVNLPNVPSPLWVQIEIVQRSQIAFNPFRDDAKPHGVRKRFSWEGEVRRI